MAERPDCDERRSSRRQALDDYREDALQLISDSLAGATHLVASRQGLYAVNEREWSQLLPGSFFGLTVRGPEIFAFEACDLPRSPLRKGRIVRLVHAGGRIAGASVVAKGLDNGCHQIDFCAGRLHVMDTYNQQIVRFGPGEIDFEALSSLPSLPAGRWANSDPRYVHANSLLRVGETYLVLLHNAFKHTGRLSEIALYDTDWRFIERWRVQGRNCHGLALLNDGTLLTCDSMAGDLLSAQGRRMHVSPHMTRGLAVGADIIAVGLSLMAPREGRLVSSGFVTFLDADFQTRAVLHVPGAPTEIRRLDGEDGGLSSYLERTSWGHSLKWGTPVVA